MDLYNINNENDISIIDKDTIPEPVPGEKINTEILFSDFNFVYRKSGSVTPTPARRLSVFHFARYRLKLKTIIKFYKIDSVFYQ